MLYGYLKEPPRHILIANDGNGYDLYSKEQKLTSMYAYISTYQTSS